MPRFHVNPERGPMKCSAQTPESCNYADQGWEHFDSKYDAYQAYEDMLAKRNDISVTLKKTQLKQRRGDFTTSMVALDKKLGDTVYDDILEYPTTQEKFDQLDSLVSFRAKSTPQAYERYRALDPKANPDSLVTEGAFKALTYDWNCYRDTTAVMVEALHASPFYKPKTIDYDESLPVGNAIPFSNFEHDDDAWYTSRYNTVGGSDVGILVDVDLSQKPDSIALLQLKKMRESKIVRPTRESVQRQMDLSGTYRSGNLYRGTVWEDRIRDDFAADHPELTVYKAKGQYVGRKHSWQRVNFDGIISTRKDGKPTGILEIKTGGVPEKWDNGVPLSYRAQTLYYLNATGLDEAYVCAVINDSDRRVFHLHKNDEIVPGSGVTMQEYVDDRVSKWFKDVKSERVAA